MNRLALIIDHEACWGCMACEVACKLENGVEPGLKFIRVGEEPVRERNGKPFFSYTVNTCLHGECVGTPCVDPRQRERSRGTGLTPWAADHS